MSDNRMKIAAAVASGLMLVGCHGVKVAAEKPEHARSASPTPPGAVGPVEYVYYDFEPITVTLNVPKKDRYVRATITLGIVDKDRQAAVALLDKRKPVLRDRLITYLSGLTLENVADSKCLNKIRREILESFNELLWPDDRPLVDHLLFKEFSVQ